MTDAQKSSADFLTAAQSILASNDDAARKQMFGAAMQAVAMLEAPLDTVWRTIMSAHAPSALMTLIKAGVIQEIAKAETSASADYFAKVTGADRDLIGTRNSAGCNMTRQANTTLEVRLLRPLTALGFVKETGLEEYGPTPITETLVDRALLGGYQFM
ncbi:hypothetical protein SLS62_011278 [Diatrype stigma]|uniref:Uncharacterized protein n=1 Tax=Diatrype stigma TaxID=117547 RepID=A0AAN9YFL6_9PEZI